MTKPSARILVVDDEPNVGMIFHRVLGESGYDVLSASTGGECLRVLAKQAPDLVFLDLRMPGMDGVETLRRLRGTHPDLPVVIMTAYQTVGSAVDCMKLGAYDYLVKPLDTDKLKSIVKQALEVGVIARNTPAAHRRGAEEAPLPGTLVAEGPEMRKVIELVDKVAATDMTVLLLGESGTGKEIVARAVHDKGPRRKGPYVVVDCAALPESLIESELFGYEKGAFTGADAAKPGKFESADGGTLFLDEIGNLPPAMQAKLLRFLQEPRVERLGGRKGPVSLNVRVVAATNANLAQAVESGAFREDLYHRLSVFVIGLPPLRERGAADLDKLVTAMAAEFGRQFSKKSLAVSPETREVLARYRWPGNVRELQNALRSAALLADDVIRPEHLPMSVRAAGPAGGEGAPPAALGDVIRRVETEHIRSTLQRFNRDLGKAAEVLGLTREELERKMREYGISA